MVILVMYVNLKIGENVRLAGDHLYGKLLFTWLPLVMPKNGVFLYCPFSHEILNLIESVSGGSPTYS